MGTPPESPAFISEIAVFVSLAEDLFTARYTCLAAFTLIIYDYLLLLGEEALPFILKFSTAH
ncbi:hypothetical protein M422DRAFT_264192 [Sphaerobolus stellatus SS14]|uniref:DUF6533 domain-containing protein n=1 Tax=Sphaerobolus stellatus (strain SS14) TaxID=990650 RepID=A0A0C9UG02_SPHS4|nr:hypothetical protein M422DRAFT_264192 [Sphaerobolus stellatus SS14]